MVISEEMEKEKLRGTQNVESEKKYCDNKYRMYIVRYKGVLKVAKVFNLNPQFLVIFSSCYSYLLGTWF